MLDYVAIAVKRWTRRYQTNQNVYDLPTNVEKMFDAVAPYKQVAWYYRLYRYMTDSRFAPRQWETALLCNDVSHYFINLIAHTLRARDCQFDNFVVAGGTVSCHYDNFRCHQWWPGCRADDLLFSEYDIALYILALFICRILAFWLMLFVVHTTLNKFYLILSYLILSHWLGASLESAQLILSICLLLMTCRTKASAAIMMSRVCPRYAGR